LGAVKYKNGQILDKFDSLVFAKEIPIYIQEVTNISLDMLQTAPRLEKV
jgi:DNA polymerase-3 subunit epsilon